MDEVCLQVIMALGLPSRPEGFSPMAYMATECQYD